MKDLFEMHLKTKEINRILLEKGFKVKNKNHINNYLKQLRKDKNGPASLSLGELEDWCAKHMEVPESEDKAFIVKSFIHYAKDDADDE